MPQHKIMTVYGTRPEAIKVATVIEALERGDHPAAAQRLRHNLTGGLPDLTSALER